MHKVEQYRNGQWHVVAQFCLIADAFAYSHLKGGVVIPKEWDEVSSAACNRRLDWLEANCGWFSAADER